MKPIGSKLLMNEGGYTLFRCPACQTAHALAVMGSHAWGWNGDGDLPTFTPSVLVTWPAKPGAGDEFKEWRTERRCHSFVTDGQIQFLNDCTHALAGQTVPLPDWSES
jgi:hypothetical protein